MGVLGVLAIGARGGSKCWRGAERSVWRAPEGYGRNLPAVPGEVAGRLVGRFARKTNRQGRPASAKLAQRSTAGLSNQD